MCCSCNNMVNPINKRVWHLIVLYYHSMAWCFKWLKRTN
jgi:hypothetical protein